MASSSSSAPGEHHLKGIALRIAAALSFATMIALGKLVSESGVGAIELLFYRSLFALPVVLLWVLMGPGLGSLKTQRPKAHLIRAAIGLSGMMCTFQAAILLPLAEATTIGFGAPLFATIFAALILGETVARHRWTAVVLGFIGIIIVMQPGNHAIPLVGATVALLSAMGTAAVAITVRQIATTESAPAIVFWFMMAGVVVTGCMLPFVGTSHSASAWTLLALVGLSGGIGQLCMTFSLRLAPVSVLVPFDYAQLLGAIVFGWLFWAAAPAWTTFAGGALIVGSGVYTLYRERRLHVQRAPAIPAP